MGDLLMTFGTIQPGVSGVCCTHLEWSYARRPSLTELAIIILTMVLLVGAVIAEELRIRADSSEKSLTPN